MFSIVIPAYDEELAIGKVVADIRDTLDKEGITGIEIIVVDDGSTDDTAAEAKAAGAQVIRNKQNIGYGFSLKQGIKAAKHDTIVITDADDTYPVDKIPELVERYKEGFNMVVGARSGPHYRESLIKSPLRYIFKMLVEFTVGRRVEDVNSGLRVFSKSEVTPFFPRLSNKFSFTTSQTLAYMLNMKFVDYVPIDYIKRVGKTKIRLFRDSLGDMQMICSAIIYFNPLKLFIILCAGTGLLGVGAFLVGLWWRWSGAIVLGFVSFLATAILLGLGLLADLISQREDKIERT